MITPRATSYGEIIACRSKTNLLAAGEDPFTGTITIVLEAGAKIKLEPPYHMELFTEPKAQVVESGENVSTEIKEPSLDEKVIKVRKKKAKK